MKPACLGGPPAFKTLLPLSRPYLGRSDRILGYISAMLESGRITNGPMVHSLETAVAARLKRPCVAVSSGTTGLILGLKSLGLRGEVILPSFTFFASAHALLWNGLTPVPADCDPKTFTLAPKSAAALMTRRTCAIMAVNIFGNPPELGPLSRLAESRGVPLIVDAAQGLGSRYRGKPSGTHGRIEVFSMTPSKTVTSGEGGLVTTSDPELAPRLRALRNYGDTGNYDPARLGLNGRLSELHAAVAVESLGMLETNVARRQRAAALYRAGLTGLPGISFQKISRGNLSAYKDFAIRVGPEFALARDRLARALRRENIETRPYFSPPLHRQRLYAAYPPRTPLLHTERLSRECLCLPIFPALADESIERVCEAIRNIHAHAGKLPGRAAASKSPRNKTAAAGATE